MNTTTGVNASFTPVFDVVRDPVPVEPVAKDIVQVCLSSSNMVDWCSMRGVGLNRSQAQGSSP